MLKILKCTDEMTETITGQSMRITVMSHTEDLIKITCRNVSLKVTQDNVHFAGKLCQFMSTSLEMPPEFHFHFYLVSTLNLSQHTVIQFYA